MERDALIATLRARLAARPDVAVAWLFGSRARGTAREDSDVDVAVLLEPRRGASLDGLPLDVEEDLEREVRLPVQVVDLDQASDDLGKRVLRDGVLLVDRAPSRRAAYEVATRNRYWDMLPIRRLYRRLA